MTTQLQITKQGLKLVCDVDKRPRPSPRLAWPLPNFPDPVGGSLLDLALETIQQTGRKGIRVTSHGSLPGGADAVWTLLHHAYQGGTPPATPAWDETLVRAPTFSLLLDQPLPRAMHVFRLRRVEAGQTTLYPSASIATPDDATAPLTLEGILADDLVSASEKAAFKAYYDSAIAEQGPLDALADQWLCSRTAYDSAVTAMTAAVTAMSPPHTDLTHDTSLGAGGGTTMLNLFRAVYAARDALRAAISTAIGNGTGDVWSDDRLTPSEKRLVKQWRDDFLNEQAGLDTQADLANVSRTTYDTAISLLEAYLNGLTSTGGWSSGTHDWTNYTTTYNLGAGGGTTGRGKFSAVSAARLALLAAINGNYPDTLTVAKKIDLLRWWAGVLAKKSILDTQADAYGVSRVAFDDAVLAIANPATEDAITYPVTSGFFATRATPKKWTDLTGPTSLGSGGGNTLYGLQKTVTTTMTSLEQALLNIAGQAAANALAAAPLVVWALVALPNVTYPNDKLVFLAANWTDTGGIVGPAGKVWVKGLYKSDLTGSTWSWIRPAVTADMLIDQLLAGQISAGAVGATELAAVIALLGTIKSSTPAYVAGNGSGHTTGSVSLTVNATAKTFTRASGSFTTEGFVVGMEITPSGASNAGNNLPQVVTAVSSSVLTCSAAGALVNETWTGTITAPGRSVGYRLSGTEFTIDLLNGTQANVMFDLGGRMAIGGWLAATLADRTMLATNRLNNGWMYKTILPWTTDGTNAPIWSGTGPIGSYYGSAKHNVVASAGNTVTKIGSIIQAVILPKTSRVANTVTLQLQSGVDCTANVDMSGTYVKAYVFDPGGSGTETLVGTRNYSTSGATALSWNADSWDISSIVGNGGTFGIRIELFCSNNNSDSISHNVNLYVGDLKIMA